MKNRFMIDRRSFLRVSATAAGGMVVSLYLPKSVQAKADPESFAPNGFIRVDPDNTISIWSKNPDIGEGIKTAMPMIVAEELEADWSKVKVQQADLNEKVYGGQGTGGSDGITGDWDNLRMAGAVAREMLTQAAAQIWGVEKESCFAAQSEVVHRPSGRKMNYGSLARRAAQLPVPKERPALKDPRQFRIIGTRVKGVDNEAIITGRPLYGLDVKVPGMLYAVIEKSPVFGGKPSSFDDSRARRVPGVRHVVQIEGLDNPTQLRPGVAVVADSTWAAMKGREALSVTWDEGPHRDESSAWLRKQFQESINKPGKTIRAAGDVEQALKQAATQLEAIYEAPFLAHVAMEPINCVADVRDGRCEIWGPMQMPMSARAVVSKATGIAQSEITIHPTRIGGGFGRRLISDYVAEAAVVSKAIKAPVQIVWTRRDDIRQDYYRPAGMHHMRGGVDSNGKLVAWQHHLVNVSRNAYRKDPRPPESTELYGMYVPRSDDPKDEYSPDLIPTMIPHCRVEYTDVKTGIPTGAWRAPSHNVNAFAIESFIDELAQAAKRDPVELRMGFLGDGKDFTFPGDNPTPYNPNRLKTVLQLAAERSGWGRTIASGRALGIAAHFTFGSYAAMVAEVSVERDRLKIHRIVAAVDCGIVVNPAGVEAQTQGGIIDGLSAAMFGEVTVDKGRAVEGNFDSYRLLRNREAPPVEIHIVQSQQRPTGFGEIALPPVAPAIANAIFAATGKRIRRMPFRAEGLTI